jgi:hypothetical protein
LKEKNWLLVGTAEDEFKIFDVKKKKSLFTWSEKKVLEGKCNL